MRTKVGISEGFFVGTAAYKRELRRYTGFYNYSRCLLRSLEIERAGREGVAH